MGLQTLREAIPTAVMHMAAAAVHLSAAVAIGWSMGTAYGTMLVAALLAAPMLALLAMLAGQVRLGSILFGASFVGMAALGIYGQLGRGLLQTALFADSSPWKVLFFVTAMLLPLLQITGIIEAARALTSGRSPLARDLE